MTIKTLPQRYPELGRLRLGEKGKKGEPVKLATWRFTSQDEYLIKVVASVYGGDVEAWSDAPDGEQWQVVTEASTVEVLIPPDAVDTALERWGSGGRQRRCDGVDCTVIQLGEKKDVPPTMVEQPCWCEAKGLTPGGKDDIKKGACDMVLRLRVVLPGLPGLGVFVMTTGSFYAITQMPSQVALLGQFAAGGALIPAELTIVPHQEKKSWERYVRDFFVPELRVRQSMHQLAELAKSAGELGSGMAPNVAGALESGGDTFRESSRPSTIGDFAPHLQGFIYACGEAKLTNDERHALCLVLSEGRTSSSKDLNISEAGRGQMVVHSGEWRSLIADAHGGPPMSAQEVIDATAAPSGRADLDPIGDQVRKLQTKAQGLPEPQRAECAQYIIDNNLDGPVRDMTDEQVRQLEDAVATFAAEAAAAMQDDAIDWVAAAKDAGVTPAKVLSAARSFAVELGVDLPKSVAEITGDSLISRTRGWLAETKAGAA